MPRADRSLEQTLIRFASDEAESLSLRVGFKLIQTSPTCFGVAKFHFDLPHCQPCFTLTFCEPNSVGLQADAFEDLQGFVYICELPGSGTNSSARNCYPVPNIESLGL